LFQIIGLVVAESENEASYAARQVVVEYEDLPAIISIQDAIEANSFYSNPMELCVGDIEQMRSESEVILEGEVNVGGQEHFYLETNCALVIPSEGNTLEIFSSTQNPNETQMHCALACGIPASNVVCSVRRIGGGFGGKESRSVQFACPVALAAYLLQKPVRMNVRRDVDMSISGQRHAFHAKYSVGCMRNGMLKFMDVQLFNNGGYSFDLSGPVLSRALLHIDGCYRWPALRQIGKICRTNQPSHTAFRGFGAPQGLTVVETIIEHISTKINMPSHEIRLKNLYQLNDRTHFHQEIDEWNIPEALEKVVELGNVRERQEAIEDFNQRHKWLKRGLSILPIKYGLNYTAKFMNQGGALVNIYTDGTVLVSHGGIEMGQGLHTKMIQITARALQISHENIRIAGTNTGIVPNGIATAGSMGTDMYGMAILNACEQLNERLVSFREGQPVDEETGEYSIDVWKSIVTSAFFNRVNMSAQGFYTVPSDRCGYDWAEPDITKRGQPFNYFTQGAACTEVEVDCLTGDHK
jgi:xanthine dehydrogenase/oxidase